MPHAVRHLGHVQTLQHGDLQTDGQHAGQGLFQQHGLQRVPGAVEGPERLEVHIHVLRPGPQWDGGGPRAAARLERHGFQSEPSGFGHHHEAPQRGRQNRVRRLRGLLHKTPCPDRSVPKERLEPNRHGFISLR